MNIQIILLKGACPFLLKLSDNSWRSIILSTKRARRIRGLGKVLFVLYILFLIYFLCLAEWYGREGTWEEFHYNLELFREIKRFVTYREQLGTAAVFANLAGNILIFVPYGFFVSMASRTKLCSTVWGWVWRWRLYSCLRESEALMWTTSSWIRSEESQDILFF